MPDWSMVPSLAALWFGRSVLVQIWAPTLDFLHRCIVTLHRNHQERSLLREIRHTTTKRRKKATKRDLVSLTNELTEILRSYSDSENAPPPEKTAGEEDDDDHERDASPKLKPVDRSA